MAVRHWIYGAGARGESRRVGIRLLIATAPALALILHEAVFETFVERTWQIFQPTWDDLGFAFLFLALTGPIMLITLRLLGHLEREIATQHAELAGLRATVAERERLSREIHDGSAQVLAFLLITIDTIDDLVSTGRGELARAELDRLRSAADEAYRDAREAIVSLHSELEGRGLQTALVNMCEQFEDRTSLRVALHVDPAAERLAPISQLQALRIVREALTNVRKHARATEIRVTLERVGEGALLVSVSDDGIGFKSESEAGGGRRLGLLTMRERAESVGGWLGITSLPGQGTTVVAELPMELRGVENGATNALPAG
jgi:signal transduction histidine kinase